MRHYFYTKKISATHKLSNFQQDQIKEQLRFAGVATWHFYGLCSSLDSKFRYRDRAHRLNFVVRKSDCINKANCATLLMPSLKVLMNGYYSQQINE